MKYLISILFVSALAVINKPKPIQTVEQAADTWMEVCNKNKIQAGCFYIIGDTVVTKQNY